MPSTRQQRTRVLTVLRKFYLSQSAKLQKEKQILRQRDSRDSKRACMTAIFSSSNVNELFTAPCPCNRIDVDIQTLMNNISIVADLLYA